MTAARDLVGPDFFQNPYPVYARWRVQEGPVYLPHTMDTSSGGVWLFARHADALQVFSQAQGVSKCIRAIRPPGVSSPFDRHMLHSDGADHLRLRRLAAQWFSGAAMRRLEPVMRAVADELLSRMEPGSVVDLMADFAEPMPLQVVAHLIGLPQGDMPQVRAWSLTLGDGFDSLLSDAQVVQGQRQALGEFLGYIARRVQEKRRAPDDTLLSHLVQGQQEERLDEEELLAMVGLLLFAGHETTVNLIGNAVHTLLAHPAQWALLRQEPARVADAIEEVLRHESPEQRTSFRIVREPLHIGAAALEPGMQIGVVIGSVNRDEAAFDHPEVFDIRRDPNPHLAFGVGMHHCLGKIMARVQGRVALSHLLARWPALQALDARPDWRHNSFFRGLRTLRVQVGEPG